MQLLVDFFPLLAFFGTYIYYSDIFVALQVLMVAMPVSFLIKWLITRKIDKMLLGSTIILLIMGSITLKYRDPVFLYWKPTVFYWLAATVFLASQFFGDKLIVQRLFGSLGELLPGQWRKLNLSWVVYFIASGFLNLYVAYNFSEMVWVKFKVFGFTAISFIFILLQTIWLVRTIKEENPEKVELD